MIRPSSDVTARPQRRSPAPHLRLAALVGLLLATMPTGTLASKASATSPAQDDFTVIDSFVREEMAHTGVPGVALAIVRGDQVVHMQGFGRADESGRPVTPQTPFFIGSVTKSFTALAVMQLVEAGRLELDAPVQRYLPWFRVADPGESAQITLRHLLNHTSGLPGSLGTAFSFRGDARPAALEETVRALATANLNRPVGASFEYCNLNYGILGLIIESVAAQTYSHYVNEHIFQPLQMRDSSSDYARAVETRPAQGHAYWWGMPRASEVFYDAAALPSGYLVSSAQDLAHYLVAQLNRGRYDGTAILSPSGIAELHSPAVPAGATAGSTFYGMGWFSGEMSGNAAVWVPGSISNFRADVILLPERRIGIIVLANAFSYTGAQGANIAPGVLSLLTGGVPRRDSSTRAPLPQLALLAVLIIQAMGIARAIWILNRWRANPEAAPRGAGARGVHVVLPLLSNLAWAGVCLVLLPSVAGVPLLDLRFIDIGQEGLLSGFLAVLWGVARSAAVLWTVAAQNANLAAPS